MRSRGVLVLGLLMASGFGVATMSGQRPVDGAVPRQPPATVDEPLAGHDSFDRYCAACHGKAAKGDGPVAPQLKTSPPDLTRLARRNGGMFPADQVAAYVSGTGRTLRTHGPAEMPVWGLIFRIRENDTRARERLDNLVQYLASIQESSFSAETEGARLFQEHCAGCHGRTGAGARAIGGVRRRSPDLTLYSFRNGGVFPSARVARIIDGRDIVAHGDRRMPVWGLAFRSSRDGLTDEQVAARIAAIVAYLEAIQRRNG